MLKIDVWSLPYLPRPQEIRHQFVVWTQMTPDVGHLSHQLRVGVGHKSLLLIDKTRHRREDLVGQFVPEMLYGLQQSTETVLGNGELSQLGRSHQGVEVVERVRSEFGCVAHDRLVELKDNKKNYSF